ncbi:MAG TPA: aldehyde dehydrogenase family protein [Acidimicrobiales bacterium]|nr:aldehyde dehydrogenase family protein [Acidimicrobiales bacterium]
MPAATALRSTSPQQPDDLVAEAPEADAGAVAAAAARARTAQRQWWSLPPARRAAALSGAAGELRGRSEELAALVVREVGKPATEAAGEVARAVAILDYYAQLCYLPHGEVLPPSAPGGLLLTQRRPHGLAGLVTPWNFPLAIPLWKAAPALAAGNGVLLKPSPEALGCAHALAEALAHHLPEGLVALVAGGAETGRAVVSEADVVSFTGSAAVGHAVAAAAAGDATPVQCEMGGHNAAIVLPGADPEATAQVVTAAAMGYAGQKCTATRRVIVVGEQPELVEALVEAVGALRVDDPAGADVVVGPVITDAARRKVMEAVDGAKRAGGRVLTGGAPPDRAGWFVAPTVVDGVPEDHPVAREETFGPFTLLQPVASVEEAVARCNAVPYGLVTSIHGRDLDQLLAVAEGVDTGMVKINGPTAGVDFYAPFGGQKASSYGAREQGIDALRFYSWSRTVTVAPHLA